MINELKQLQFKGVELKTFLNLLKSLISKSYNGRCEIND